MEKEKEKDTSETVKANEIADFILDTGAFLMASGAHSGRVWRNCKRIAGRYGYHLNINPTFTGILVSVWDKNDDSNAVTRYKTSPQNLVHLEVLTLISHLSWRIADGITSFADARVELEGIKKQKHYPFWFVAFMVGVSCACLCVLAGGNVVDAGITFLAAMVGSLVKYYITRKNFNQFLAVIVASCATTMIAGADTILGIGKLPEITLATSVLYLIPGVPLINSVIDLLEGYFSASIARSLYAASVLLCIAVGMTLSITLLGISKF
ncbi:MAG: hypothetical protein H6Q20_1395 [Bacteroidetes bacterium]|jgi:uncharacterized membrane protein YjjP (DUF1212 family)|nr:hypothetical protein [Bacteroidota bacterium]